ncbi:MAG: zinc ABC transporter substrate-binding protein, partial [Pseudobutyrivibrio sp.]|nr:zinc ABC transporter substrate-binding protein [Pseudobutyrivibrio sp.]
HVWLSLINAKVLVGEIADTLEAVDASNADAYKANATDYIAKLDALDEEYESAVNNATVNTILFGDRFPFRYMVDDYNLGYYAAFVGCSAETEASFETITSLAGKVDELGLNTVLTIENSDQKIAKTIIENTNSKDAKVLSMDSMQSTTTSDVNAGATYLGIMEDNLKVLTQALN